MEYKRHSEKCWKTHHNHSYHHCFTDDHRGGYRTVQSLPFPRSPVPLSMRRSSQDSQCAPGPGLVPVLLVQKQLVSWNYVLSRCGSMWIEVVWFEEIYKAVSNDFSFFFFQLHLCKFFIGRTFFALLRFNFILKFKKF